MEILIVSNFLPPKTGGIERFSHELATELQKSPEINVTVACSEWKPPRTLTNLKYKEPSYQTVYFPSLIIANRFPIPKIWTSDFWRTFFSLNGQYAIVIYQSHLFILNWILAVKFRSITRTIWINHGCNFVPTNSLLISHIEVAYEKIGMSILRLLCKEYFAQSKNAAEWVESKVGVPFSVLSNAVNLELFDFTESAQRAPFKSKVLFVGRLVHGKGVLECCNVVLEANKILELKGSKNRFEFEIIGSGPLSSDISAQYPDSNFIIQGERDQKFVIDRMYSADILIQAYAQPEGLTSVALEGIGTGMLVVTTELGGGGALDECISYKPSSIKSMPEKLVEAGEDKICRSELCAAGIEFIKTNYTWNIVARRLLVTEDDLGPSI